MWVYVLLMVWAFLVVVLLVIHIWHVVTDCGHGLVLWELPRVILRLSRDHWMDRARHIDGRTWLRSHLEVHLLLQVFFSLVWVDTRQVLWLLIDKVDLLLQAILVVLRDWVYGEIKVDFIGLGLEGVLDNKGVRVEHIVDFLGLSACHCESKHANDIGHINLILSCNLIL